MAVWLWLYVRGTDMDMGMGLPDLVPSPAQAQLPSGTPVVRECGK